MNYLIFQPNQIIVLVAKINSTPSQAINEAIEFCINNICEVDLNYKGFLFSIDKNTSIKEKIKDYNYYLENRYSMML